MELWTAFTIGIVGSLHCVGMCGPLAMAMPYKAPTHLQTGLNIAQYHLGRILTYALLGGLIGLLGKGIFLAGMQQALSIITGVLLVIAAFLSLRVTSRMINNSFAQGFYFKVKSGMGRLLKSGSSTSLLLIGMLNGLLPCGLVYMAIVGAMTTGSVINGMAYMALFGAGTVPLVLLASFAGTFANMRLRNTLRKLTPVFLVCFGALLIMRGMNFDIPAHFSFWEGTMNQPMCH